MKKSTWHYRSLQILYNICTLWSFTMKHNFFCCCFNQKMSLKLYSWWSSKISSQFVLFRMMLLIASEGEKGADTALIVELNNFIAKITERGIKSCRAVCRECCRRDMCHRPISPPLRKFGLSNKKRKQSSDAIKLSPGPPPEEGICFTGLLTA